MKKGISLLWATIIVLMLLLLVFTAISAVFSPVVFYCELPVAVIAVIFGTVRLISARKDSRKFLEFVGNNLGSVKEREMNSFPLPVAVTDTENKIIWCNSVFFECVMKGEEPYGAAAEELFEGYSVDVALLPEGCETTHVDGTYRIYANCLEEPTGDVYALYFVDKTEERHVAKLYADRHPAVLNIVLDNLDDLLANCRESERSRIMGEVENLFEDFAAKNHALIRRYENSKYMAIVEEQYLCKMEAERFSILDKARKILTSESLPVTLSIGVARGDHSLNKLNEISKQALEMALGRGGDQAAVRNINGYEFYGGYAKGIEKRTKVKTRVVATALCDLISSCSNVIIMGHRYGDLDCIGAAFAMCEACRDMEKSAFVAVNRETCLAKPLIERTELEGNTGLFISPEEALQLMNDGTLLIIVDTHVRNILESNDIYAAANNVVVIDHHRRTVGSVDNAVIFYHEPFASSASEMVTELLQYFDSRCNVTKAEAEALLAGIMLDTKSFTMRSGVRTFEAAAYLKKKGADTVHVKQLFAGSLESYRHRSTIVSKAEIYRGCAISFAKDYDDIGIVAPQAADELLSIDGVASSVVMYKTASGVSLSARSLGSMNVQIIMEALGGGGHQTMAGAQMPGATPLEAAKALKEAIDNYYINAEGHDDFGTDI